MTQDSLTRTGARQLAVTIATYWIERGYHGIKVEAYKLNRLGDYGIKTNIGANGLPPVTKAGRPQTSGAGLGRPPKPIC